MGSDLRTTPPSASSSARNRMRKNAAGARTDAGWQHGLDLGNRKVKCKYCDATFSGGIYRFKHHLARTSRNVQPCQKVPENVKAEILRLLEENEAATQKRKITFSIENEIKANFKDVEASYGPIFDIIDQRWYNQLNRALHVVGYFLNPMMHYSPEFENSGFIKAALYICLETMCSDDALARKIDCQISDFTNAKGLFGLNVAKLTRDAKSPVDWWDSFGDDTPELKIFAMRILSLTCSSSGCERNWSAFEMVHSKRRNRLDQQRMNDLVYVTYNLKLHGRVGKKENEVDYETLNLDEVGSDDEWITEESHHTNEEWNFDGLGTSAHDGDGDDDFLESSIRDQFGGGEEDGIGMDAPFVVLD